MPQFSGGAALRVVNEIAADMPFIYVSGTIGEDVAVEALKSGAQDYVMKSNLKRLPAALKRGIQEAAARRQQRLIQKDRDRLVLELEAALHEVRSLGGLLPFCTHCHRLRERDGAWQTIQDFLRAHSDVHFIRCLCPACRVRLEGFPGSEDRLSEYP